VQIGLVSLNLSLTVGERTAAQPDAAHGGPPDAGPDLPPGVLAEIARGITGSGTPLPPDVLAWARATYGVDLSDTRVISDARAQRLNADAGSSGLALGARQILLPDPADEVTLRHETAHAAQAAGGSAAGREQREGDAVRAEEVYARPAQPAGPSVAGIDLQALADRVYQLLVEQVQRDRERRL
jgi:hypothetical protein